VLRVALGGLRLGGGRAGCGAVRLQALLRPPPPTRCRAGPGSIEGKVLCLAHKAAPAANTPARQGRGRPGPGARQHGARRPQQLQLAHGLCQVGRLQVQAPRLPLRHVHACAGRGRDARRLSEGLTRPCTLSATAMRPAWAGRAPFLKSTMADMSASLRSPARRTAAFSAATAPRSTHTAPSPAASTCAAPRPPEFERTRGPRAGLPGAWSGHGRPQGRRQADAGGLAAAVGGGSRAHLALLQVEVHVVVRRGSRAAGQEGVQRVRRRGVGRRRGRRLGLQRGRARGQRGQAPGGAAYVGLLREPRAARLRRRPTPAPESRRCWDAPGPRGMSKPSPRARRRLRAVPESRVLARRVPRLGARGRAHLQQRGPPGVVAAVRPVAGRERRLRRVRLGRARARPAVPAAAAAAAAAGRLAARAGRGRRGARAPVRAAAEQRGQRRQQRARLRKVAPEGAVRVAALLPAARVGVRAASLGAAAVGESLDAGSRARQPAGRQAACCPEAAAPARASCAAPRTCCSAARRCCAASPAARTAASRAAARSRAALALAAPARRPASRAGVNVSLRRAARSWRSRRTSSSRASSSASARACAAPARLAAAGTRRPGAAHRSTNVSTPAAGSGGHDARAAARSA